MEIAAIKKAKDEVLQELGLVHRGDILALRAFVDKGVSSETAEKKRSLLQSLKNKFSGERNRKYAKKRKGNTLPTSTTRTELSKRSVATSRKVYAGWQHYDPRQKRYISVRLVNGAGMRNIDIPVDATKADGTSIFGKTYEMQFSLGNFKCEEVSEDDFTLSGYIQRNKLSKCRLYILSKLYVDMIWSDSKTEEDLQLPVSSINSSAPKAKRSIGESSNSKFSQSKATRSEAIASSSQDVAFQDDQIGTDYEECSEEATLPDDLKNVDRPDMLLKLRAACNVC